MNVYRLLDRVVPSRWSLFGALLGVLLAWTYTSRAQSNTVDYLPILSSQQPNAPATLAVLKETDTTFVNAALVPGTCRVIVTYIDRANGNRLHVAEDIGTQLEEIPMPRLAAQLQAEQPDFVLPGSKHASGFPIVVCGRLRIYANARAENDTDGPFQLVRLDMPIP